MRLFQIIQTAMCLWVATAVAAPVAVIRGSVSVPEGERRFAASLASHVERWLKESGVEVTAADDGTLPTVLAGKKVAVLVYMASPNARQVATLSEFVSRGGKLIICYSSSQELAALMGMKTVGYVKGSTDGRWSQMHFVENRPKGVPGSILQTSQNLFVVEPLEGRSRVLAWWCDRAGAQTSEPAWLISQNGCWMTHVLLADGDAEAKGRLLLALAASYDATLWKSAAMQVLRQSHALEKVVQTAMTQGNATRAAKAWQTLEGISRGADQSLAKGKAFEAWNAAQDVKARCYEVYGLLQPTRKGEIRAVWDRSGMGLYPGQWARTCRLLKDAGISDLYVNVAGAGFAHFGSNVLPRSKVFDEQGDQLAACLAAAKPLGLRVHAWIFCFSTDGATAERIAIFKRKGWVLSDETAKPWLDPANPEVRAYLASAVRELALNPKLDGVHLDFVRYPDFISCFSTGTKRRFEKDSRRMAADWPEDVKTGALRQMFIQWRAKQVSDFVQEARREMKRDAPGKLLTAAVYGKYPSCLDAVGQDWESWTNIGLVDYVVPMDYTEDFSKFSEWLTAQTRTRKQAMRVVPGIGVTAAESRLDAIQVIDQIQALRRAGCPGFALFDLDTTLRQEILPVLRMGVTDAR